jgi:hypothetical protein
VIAGHAKSSECKNQSAKCKMKELLYLKTDFSP